MVRFSEPHDAPGDVDVQAEARDAHLHRDGVGLQGGEGGPVPGDLPREVVVVADGAVRADGGRPGEDGDAFLGDRVGVLGPDGGEVPPVVESHARPLPGVVGGAPRPVGEVQVSAPVVLEPGGAFHPLVSAVPQAEPPRACSRGMKTEVNASLPSGSRPGKWPRASYCGTVGLSGIRRSSSSTSLRTVSVKLPSFSRRSAARSPRTRSSDSVPAVTSPSSGRSGRGTPSASTSASAVRTLGSIASSPQKEVRKACNRAGVIQVPLETPSGPVWVNSSP